VERLVSVIMPTRERPEQALRCIERLLQTSVGYDVEAIVVADGDDTTGDVIARAGVARVIMPPERLSAPRCWNLGAAAATGDVLVLAADDLWWFHGWIGEMTEWMAAFPNGDGMIGFNDLAQDGNKLATHYAVSRRFAVEQFGGVLVCPQYRHYFIDNEATARGMRAGRYRWAQNSVVEHRHPAWRKAKSDGLYASRAPLMAEDQAMFQRRRAAGFPDDFEAVIMMRSEDN
jgi:glycosyltransferase involved in cell wall biosynthesis